MTWKAARAKRHPPMTDAQYLERIWSRSSKNERGCWVWNGSVNTKGYGQVSVRNKRWGLHRLSYTWHKGPIPAGLQVCHECDNPRCWNPDHLWIGTNRENQDDAHAKGRKRAQSATHCDRGHEFTPENTRRYGKAARRTCLICQRARMRINAGWPKELAFSIESVPPGSRPVSGKWRRTAHG